MKRLFIVLSCLVCLYSKAQQPINPFPKTINVNGSAEMEVIPDEIYVQIDLKEYQKRGDKIPLDQIKSEFLQNVRSVGIPDSAVTIASYEGFNGYPWWRKTRKDKAADLYASIAYQVKLNNSYKVDELVRILDDDATINFQVVRTSHSRINEWRKQLKIQAIKAAREKAEYLSAAINEKVGEAVTITEPTDLSIYYGQRNAYAKASNYVLATDQLEGKRTATDDPGVDFRKIKLKFDLNVVFAIK
jgi:uncharacterized protein YggE